MTVECYEKKPGRYCVGMSIRLILLGLDRKGNELNNTWKIDSFPEDAQLNYKE